MAPWGRSPPRYPARGTPGRHDYPGTILDWPPLPTLILRTFASVAIILRNTVLYS
jgi:hypothetical protein